MNRRTVLALAGGSLLFGGCLGDDTPSGSSAPGSTDECILSNTVGAAPAIEVTADGEFADGEVVVDLRWNAQTQTSVKESQDALIGYEADPDETFLLFRIEVTNTTDDTVTIDRFNFELEYKTPDVVDTVSASISGIEDIDVQIRSDGTADGVLPFAVPDTTTVATLRHAVPNFPERVPVASNAECDESLDIGLPVMNS